MEELENQLSELVKKGIDAAEKTGQFVIDQAPELLQEFYRWQIASNIMKLLLGIALFIVGRYVPYLWLSKDKEHCDYRFFGRYGYEEAGVAYFLFIIAATLSIAMASRATSNLIYIAVAPKLYLIDYFIK